MSNLTHRNATSKEIAEEFLNHDLFEAQFDEAVSKALLFQRLNPTTPIPYADIAEEE